MERDDLLPRHTNGREHTTLLRHGEREGRDAPVAGVRNTRGTLVRQAEVPEYHATWVNAEFDTVVRTDVRANLVAKAKRWKMLAWEPIAQGVDVQAECYPSGEYLDKHEVAAMYVKDALAGRECMPCIRDKTSLNALKLVRNKTWNKVLNVCTIVQLALPMLEVQRCLPCFGPQKISYLEGTYLLHIGWRLTPLGSMWLECVLCCLYVYDIYLIILANGGGRAGLRWWWWWRRTKLPRWQVVRTWLVFILALGLLTNMCSHYLLRMTWHRWSRVTLPFLLISRRTYLKLFVGGVIRVLPGMVPVVFLMSFVVFFYAFMGYVLYRTAPRDPSFLSDLGLFEEPLSSALTFLRMFMSIPFMMDVEILYYGNKGVQAMSLSYGVIMVIFLGALVPAVANRNFQNQSKESFIWMNEQRKIALTRAYLLMSDPANSMVDRKNWVRLMSFVNPDCERESALALFKAAREAEQDVSSPKDDNHISKAGFFMMCALGKDRFEPMKTPSPPDGRRPSRAWAWLSKKLKCLLDWPNTEGSIPLILPLSEIIYFLAILVQGYQIVREGDDPSESPPWTYTLGAWLIAYFTLYACCQMVARGPLTYLMTYRHALDLALSIVGVAFYCGFWIRGEQSRRVYHILQAVRIVMLWSLLRSFRRTADVAERLELVFPDLVRSSFVLFSVTYSYSIVAYALYCRTPLGQEPLGAVADHSMVKRWAAYEDVGSFGSMLLSFASMTDVIMLSNWPMFMDAAGDVGNSTLANIFFFSFKGLTFYFVMPVMLGFIVKSYMAAKLSSQESGSGGEGLVRDRTASSMSSMTGIRRSGLNGEDRPGPVTTPAGGHGRDTDREDDNSCEDDLDDCVVKVTERKRTMSTTFWGGEHARQDSANITGTLTSLEDENCRLRLRVEQLEMENQALLDEQSRLPPKRRSITPIVEAKEEEEDVAV